MPRRFRVRNVSRKRGVQRVWIPIRPGLTLKPALPLRKYAPAFKATQGRCTADVPEELLKGLVKYLKNGQITITALDGGQLPAFFFKPEAEEKVEEEPPAPEEEVEETDDAEIEAENPKEETPEEPKKAYEDPGGFLSGSAKDIIEVVNALPDADDLEEYLIDLIDAEKAGKDRKTVLDAIEARASNGGE